MLFEAYSQGELTLANRVVMAPLSRCRCDHRDAVPTELVVEYYRQRAGAGLFISEGVPVSDRARGYLGTAALWNDAQAAGWHRVTAAVHAAGGRIFAQLWHCGRVAHSRLHADGSRPAGVSAQPAAGVQTLIFDHGQVAAVDCEAPVPLSVAEIRGVVADFAHAARLARDAGFDGVEIHGANGYLLDHFRCPLLNDRDDAYGGTLENRLRFPLECFAAARGAFPADRPAGVRLSATDWIEGGWDLEQSVVFAAALEARGCDVIHVSSGGLRQDQRITTGPVYQTGFASEIRRRAAIPTIAVGEITEPLQAETIVRSGQADMVALARGMLWDPRWIWKAALALGAELELPPPYARCNPALRAKPFVKR
jgi:2,4-dienoyl-CoA reductase-like NADH-dependent reductase (Old Yellow Enzyme family)